MAKVVKWHGQAWRKGFDKTLERKLDGISEMLRGEVVKNINIPSPPRSAPGEFPHVDTGRLKQSIFWDKTGKFTRIIGTTVKHGLFLEIGTKRMAARPFLRRTLKMNMKRIKRVLTRARSTG